MSSEAAKVRARVKPYLDECLAKGLQILDLGCGTEKICPEAIGVDDESEQTPTAAQIRIDLDRDLDGVYKSYGLSFCGRTSTDVWGVVFSSHTLEHLSNPIRFIVESWLRFLPPQGVLILYLPNEHRYRYDPNDPARRNPAHVHYLTPEVFRWHVENLSVPVEIERFEVEEGPGEYSFLVVLRKK